MKVVRVDFSIIFSRPIRSSLRPVIRTHSLPSLPPSASVVPMTPWMRSQSLVSCDVSMASSIANSKHTSSSFLNSFCWSEIEWMRSDASLFRVNLVFQHFFVFSFLLPDFHNADSSSDQIVYLPVTTSEASLLGGERLSRNIYVPYDAGRSHPAFSHFISTVQQLERIMLGWNAVNGSVIF